MRNCREMIFPAVFLCSFIACGSFGRRDALMAQEIARSLYESRVTPRHLLLALLKEEDFESVKLAAVCDDRGNDRG